MTLKNIRGVTHEQENSKLRNRLCKATLNLPNESKRWYLDSLELQVTRQASYKFCSFHRSLENEIIFLNINL